MSDFLNWEDLNLDELLGEYTDDETCDIDMSSDSDAECSTPADVAKAVELPSVPKKNPVYYGCPACAKSYRSVSGFRGHVVRVHNMPGLRASDYRQSAGTSMSTEPTETTKSSSRESSSVPSSSEAKLPVLTKDSFFLAFADANRTAWNNIVADPVYSVEGSGGQSLQTYAQNLCDHCNELNSTGIVCALENIFVGISLSSQTDQEKLLMRLHSLRTDSETVDTFVQFSMSEMPTADVETCRQLFQVWLRHLTSALMKCVSDMCSAGTNRSSGQVDILTDVEQNVLYYVCGYMVSKLKASVVRHPRLKRALSLIDMLATKQPKETGHFVEKYREWVTVQSRGGLLYSMNDYYLMVREFDKIFRSMTCAYSLQSENFKQVAVANIMESDVVNYYWEKILNISNMQEIDAMPVLEYLVSLFVAIKGHAWAQKQKNKIFVDKLKAEKKRPHTKESQSLRGKLKKYC